MDVLECDCDELEEIAIEYLTGSEEFHSTGEEFSIFEILNFGQKSKKVLKISAIVAG